MPARLVALDKSPSILLDKPILLIGRHPECDIQIESRKISRRHCCIAHVSDYLVVRDLGSTNGIRINGDRVQEGRLHDGDELTIGNNRYRLSWGVVSDAPPPAPDTPAERKPAAHASSPLRVNEDELLEASDEPVPLDEPGVPPPEPSPRRIESPQSPVAPEKSFVLPDNLELMPKSDHFSSGSSSSNLSPPA